MSFEYLKLNSWLNILSGFWEVDSYMQSSWEWDYLIFFFALTAFGNHVLFFVLNSSNSYISSNMLNALFLNSGESNTFAGNGSS